MKIEIPTECPCCAYKLVLVNDQLFCRNTACGAQLNKKLEHFTKVLGIKGIGAKTIEKLQLADITEIFYLDEAQLVTDLGSKTIANKLLVEIEKAKSADLATVLAAFSIPLVGNTASTKICGVVKHISEINAETCKAAGLGEKVTNNLLSWLETEFLELKDFLPFTFSSQQVSKAASSGELVCITGKLSSFKTKAEAYKALEDAGFSITETVNKSTAYLVDEDSKGSSKRKKADELGVSIIQNLKTFLKEKTND